MIGYRIDRIGLLRPCKITEVDWFKLLDTHRELESVHQTLPYFHDNSNSEYVASLTVDEGHFA